MRLVKVVVVTCFLGGCQTWQESLSAHRERLVEMREVVPPEQRESIDRTLEALDALEKKVRDIEANPALEVATAVGSVIAPPWGATISSILIAAWAFLRGTRYKRIASTIVRSIDAIPAAKTALTSNRQIVNTIQTREVRNFVDHIQGKN